MGSIVEACMYCTAGGFIAGFCFGLFINNRLWRQQEDQLKKAKDQVYGLEIEKEKAIERLSQKKGRVSC